MIDEQHLSLKEYYKVVRLCKVCHKQYGDDTRNKKHKDTCPICVGRRNNRLRARYKGIEPLEEKDEN